MQAPCRACRQELDYSKHYHMLEHAWNAATAGSALHSTPGGTTGAETGVETDNGTPRLEGGNTSGGSDSAVSDAGAPRRILKQHRMRWSLEDDRATLKAYALARIERGVDVPLLWNRIRGLPHRYTQSYKRWTILRAKARSFFEDMESQVC